MLLKLNIFFSIKRESHLSMGKFSWIIRKFKGQKQETYKYLGVLIGEDLTFDEHVNCIRGKLVSAAYAKSE